MWNMGKEHPSPALITTMLVVSMAWLTHGAAVGDPSYLTNSPGYQGSYRLSKAFQTSGNSQRETSATSNQQSGGSGGSGSSSTNAATAAAVAAANAAANRPSEHVVVLNDGTGPGDSRLTSGQLRPPYTILYQDGLKVTVVDRSSGQPQQQLYPQDFYRPFQQLPYNPWPWSQTSLVPATASNYIPPWYPSPLGPYRPQSPFEQQQQQVLLQQAATTLSPFGATNAGNPFLSTTSSAFGQNPFAATSGFGLQQPGAFPQTTPWNTGVTGGSYPFWIPPVSGAQTPNPSFPTSSAYLPQQNPYYPAVQGSNPASPFLPQNTIPNGLNPWFSQYVNPGLGNPYLQGGFGYKPSGAVGNIGSQQQDGSEPTILPASEKGVQDIRHHLNNFVYPSLHSNSFHSSQPLYRSSSPLVGQWGPLTDQNLLGGNTFSNQQQWMDSSYDGQRFGQFGNSAFPWSTANHQVSPHATSSAYSRLPLMGEFNSGLNGYNRGNTMHSYYRARK